MNYIIFDLEWNSFKGIRSEAHHYKKFNQKTRFFNEIIEIGAIKLNNKLQYIDNFRMYIKPNIYKTVNPKIVQLTKIDNENLKYGFDFKKALKHFKKWIGKDYILCSWCDSDIKVLKRNIQYYNPNYKVEELVLPYLDIQKYCCSILKYNRQVSLKEVINSQNIVASTDKLHQALDDTKLTVDIFKKMFDEEKIKHFIVDDINCIYDSVHLKINLNTLDKAKLRARCAKCGKYSKKLRTSFDNKKRRINILSYCYKCNLCTKQKIKVKRNLLGDLIYNFKTKIVETSDL